MFLLREGVVIKHYIDDTLFFAYPNVCCRTVIFYNTKIPDYSFLLGKWKKWSGTCCRFI